MKRLLIKQYDARFQGIVSGFPKLLPSLETLKETYEGLNLGKFNNVIFQDIRENGSSNIAEAYKAELNKQLDKAGVKFPALRKQQFEGSLHPLHDFESAVLELPNSTSSEHKINYHTTQHTTYLLAYVSYDNSAAEFIPYTEETKESILEEQCRTYTENEAEYKIWVSAQEFLLSYDKMREAIKEAGVENYYMGSGSLIVDRIITNNEGDLTVNINLIDSIRNVINSQLAQNRRQEEDQRKNQEAKDKREAAHKKAFDISTKEGQAAFEAFHAERGRKEEQSRQKVTYLV